MSKPIVYLDLDRTLFRTEQTGDIWQQLELLHPEIVHAATEHERSGEFYMYSDDMYCHDVSAQLRSLGLDPTTIYDDLTHSDLGDGRFEYQGSTALITYLKRVATPVILTYGTDDYQRFKASLCPSLSGISVETILEPKPQWLHEHAASGWLVDDKPIGGEVPATITFVQVALESKASHDVSWPVCESLGEVEQYFRDGLESK